MPETSQLIGGVLCRDPVGPGLMDSEDRELYQFEKEALWQVFEAIGEIWGNLPHRSENVKSSWLEFIRAKTRQQPLYTGEYANGVQVMQELRQSYGEPGVWDRLFFHHGVPDGPPLTRLAHFRRYVVEEFIRVQVVMGGFQGFVKPSSLNYKGYVGGSRYNLTSRVRAYEPKKGGEA